MKTKKKNTKAKTKATKTKEEADDNAMLKKLNEVISGKNLTPAKKKAMGMLVEMIMETQKDLIEHFVTFVEKEKIEKEFKTYCKKNPVKLALGGIMTLDMNEMGGCDDSNCEDCNGKDTPPQKADMSYIG